MSAGEEPLEAPLFEIPLQDAVVAPGVDVLLKCIVTANPPPQGKLRQFEQGGGAENLSLQSGFRVWETSRKGFPRVTHYMAGLGGTLTLVRDFPGHSGAKRDG